MLKYISSSPGKVILFGEHVVLYNTKAIAVSLSSLRIHIELLVEKNNNINLNFYNLLGGQGSISISLKELKSFFYDIRNLFKEKIIKPNEIIINKLEEFANKYSDIIPVKRSIKSVLFLIMSIIPDILYNY